MSEYIITCNEATALWIGNDVDSMKPLVRCRGCAFAYRVYWPESCDVPPEFLNCHGPLVAHWDYERDEPAQNPVEPDGFCAWGKRRGDA